MKTAYGLTYPFIMNVNCTLKEIILELHMLYSNSALEARVLQQQTKTPL